MGEDKQEIQDRRFFVNGKKRGENRGNDRWKITDESSIVENYFEKKMRMRIVGKEYEIFFFYRSWTTGIMFQN